MEDYNRAILANKIKELRNEKHLKQSEFGKMLHVSQQTVAAWETGRTVPGSDTLNTLADFFNVSTDYLLGRSKNKNKKEAEINNTDLSKMLDNANSYDGKPMNEYDRKIINNYLIGYFQGKGTD